MPKLKDLPFGTRFHVENGNWYGRIAGAPDALTIFVEYTGSTYPLTEKRSNTLRINVVDENGLRIGFDGGEADETDAWL